MIFIKKKYVNNISIEIKYKMYKKFFFREIFANKIINT